MIPMALVLFSTATGMIVPLLFNAVKSACPVTAGGQGDPHLLDAHGGRSDFRGRNNTVFNLVSAEKLTVNFKTCDGVYRLNGGTVNGSWIVGIYVVATTTAGPLDWTYDAARISPASLLGFSSGTCDGRPFKLTGARMGRLLRDGPTQRVVCGEVLLQVVCGVGAA